MLILLLLLSLLLLLLGLIKKTFHFREPNTLTKTNVTFFKKIIFSKLKQYFSKENIYNLNTRDR